MRLRRAPSLIQALLFLIILGGSFLRLFQLSQQSYWMDEGYTINAIISQLEHGTRGFASVLDSGHTYFCPLYCTPTALITQFLGQNPFTYRLLGTFWHRLHSGHLLFHEPAF